MGAKFQGAFVALVTPFKKSGEVDKEAFCRLIEHCLAGGVAGLVPCGTTGEKATLTPAEHREVIALCVEQTAGRAAVIAGTGSNDTAHAAMMATFAREAGADAALSVTPYYNKPTQEGLYRHYSTIAAQAQIPLVVYNVPGRTSVNLAPETMIRLWDNPLIAGLKDASGNVEYAMTLLQAGLPDGFSLLSGDDSLAVPMIALGGHGCISVIANEMPADFARLVNLALAGRMEEALTLHYKLLPLMNANFLETNPLPVKTALAMMGLIEENFRLPLCEMKAENKDKLGTILAKLNLLGA
jgi:4-hydroxy-tetrahydrodipicolinate synthase